jgi:hypothetical protein
LENERIPSVVAMLICDQIITEEGTNKRSLIGVFDNLFTLQFPVIVPKVGVYAKLADAEGQYLFRIRVVDLKDESLIGEVQVQADIPDGSQYSEIALNFGGVPLPDEGRYEFQLYADDVYLHRVVVNVKKSEVSNA